MVVLSLSNPIPPPNLPGTGDLRPAPCTERNTGFAIKSLLAYGLARASVFGAAEQVFSKPRNRLLRLILTAIIVMAFSSTISVADGGLVPMKVGTGTGNEYLRGYLQVYEDKDSVETFESIQPKTFHTIQQAVPNFGFSQSTYWIKFALVNETPESLRLLLELRNQLLDFIDFFIISSQKPSC